MFFWSQRILPKVFGGVFILIVGTKAHANNYNEALRASKEAIMVSSGAKEKLQNIQKDYEKILIQTAKDLKIQNELFVSGAIFKTFRDKRIDFKYKNNFYTITPNFIQVRIPF